jgi:ABC-2 type transport system ATP-binding protein
VDEPVIEARGLRKDFGRKRAVADLTLSVAGAEVFGFLGPNGAGKTTSMKMLLGLVHPTSGSARLLGRPVQRAESRIGVGYLPEHFCLHEWLSGEELLLFHGRLLGIPHGELREQVGRLLEQVGLVDAGPRRVLEYSKGMRQRLGLAQALLGEPRLVFLDEPTSGLDPLGRKLVREIIANLRESGTTVFLNSHLLSEVEVTCDRAVFVKGGRVVAETRLGPRSRDLELELRLDRRTPGLLDGIARFGHDLRLEGETLLMAVASEERLPELSRWLASEGVGIYHMAARPRSLEEVFLDVVGEDDAEG